MSPPPSPRPPRATSQPKHAAPEHDGDALMSVSRHSSPRQVMGDRQAARTHASQEWAGAGLGEGAGHGDRWTETRPPTIATVPTSDTDYRHRSTCARTRPVERQQTHAGASACRPPPPGRPHAMPLSYTSANPPKIAALPPASPSRHTPASSPGPLAHGACAGRARPKAKTHATVHANHYPFMTRIPS